MRPIVILTIVVFVCTLLLSLVSEATREPIRKAAEAQRQKAISSLFDFELKSINDQTHNDLVYMDIVGTQGERALAIEVSNNDGYSGYISAVVGIQDGKILNYAILSHTETPGLGDKIAKEGAFKSQFSGKNLSNTAWKVRKDGGDIDAISAATISSRALTSLLEHALQQAKEIQP